MPVCELCGHGDNLLREHVMGRQRLRVCWRCHQLPLSEFYEFQARCRHPVWLGDEPREWVRVCARCGLTRENPKPEPPAAAAAPPARRSRMAVALSKRAARAAEPTPRTRKRPAP